MKKLFIILSLAMVLPVVANAQKIGFVNYQEIVSQMPELKAVEAQMDTLTQQYEGEFLKMRQELENKYKEYQANAETMPESIKEVRASEIGELQQRIEMFQQTAQTDLQNKQRSLMEPVINKLKEAISAVGKDNGYTYIFDATAMLYTGNDADDVQPLVKAKLGLK